MKREIKSTLDGSKTLYIKELDECYHSHNGALQEAEHVFIKNGIKKVNNYEINILELGFGTGLNVLVTINEFLKTDKNHKIFYFTTEKYPISEQESKDLAYDELFDNEIVKNIYHTIHQIEWNKMYEIYPNFYLQKFNIDFYDIKSLHLPKIDVIYYDCFGAKIQPDLWEKPLLEIVSKKLKNNALLTTYSSKGSFRRNLEEIGFSVEKIPGPLGKREMINAIFQKTEHD